MVHNDTKANLLTCYQELQLNATIIVPFFLFGLVLCVEVLEEVRGTDLTLLVLLLWFREQELLHSLPS